MYTRAVAEKKNKLINNCFKNNTRMQLRKVKMFMGFFWWHLVLKIHFFSFARYLLARPNTVQVRTLSN